MGEEPRITVWPFIPIPLLIPIPPRFFDEWLMRMWPQEYRESLVHLQNAQIEVLKAIDVAINKMIKRLEELQKETKPQKEKVQVE